MARRREFDMDKALDGAVKAFWDHGFEGTSLPRLLRAMRIARSSFYRFFRGKAAVYLAALKRYETLSIDGAVAILTNEAEPGPARVERLFGGILALHGTPAWRRGCFLCKALVDRAPHDAAVERVARGMIARLENAFAAALQSGGRPGAQRLTGAFIGLHVLRNAGASRAAAEALVRQSVGPMA